MLTPGTIRRYHHGLIHCSLKYLLTMFTGSGLFCWYVMGKIRNLSFCEGAVNSVWSQNVPFSCQSVKIVA